MVFVTKDSKDWLAVRNPSPFKGGHRSQEKRFNSPNPMVFGCKFPFRRNSTGRHRERHFRTQKSSCQTRKLSAESFSRPLLSGKSSIKTALTKEGSGIIFGLFVSVESF